MLGENPSLSFPLSELSLVFIYPFETAKADTAFLDVDHSDTGARMRSRSNSTIATKTVMIILPACVVV
jgi:hypothetical protein